MSKEKTSKRKALYTSLILLAAGASSRFKDSSKRQLNIKKQWLRIGHIPLWRYVTNRWLSLCDFEQVVVVLPPKEVEYSTQWAEDINIISGGNTRQESLKNALQHISTPYVLVSDVARCITDGFVLDLLLEHLENNSCFDCVVPYIEVFDTIYNDAHGYIDRQATKLIQTPQLSRTQMLINALSNATSFSDESSAIHAHKGKVLFVSGSKKLQKLTHEKDIYLLKHFPCPSHDCFVGHGFDVHGLKAHNQHESIRLGGVDIPCSYAIDAHSDGDVGIHALIDALLGGIGAGDIGVWFPDTDDRYKGIDSAKLLTEVVDFVQAVGYTIIHVDLTFIIQSPKIAPYKKDMQNKLASLLNIDKYHVNIKATTTEHLGFLGRKEGIAAQSTATLKYLDWRNL